VTMVGSGRVILGIEANRKKEQELLEVAAGFRALKDAAEVKRLGDELGRMVFGK
jgi:hypothetical protein